MMIGTISEEEYQKALDAMAKEDLRRVSKKEIKEMKPTFIFPYHSNSLGAKKLAENCSFELRKREYILLAFDKITEGKFKVINWGSRNSIESQTPDVHIEYFNDPKFVGKIQNHYDFLSLMKKNGIPTLDFTNSLSEAIEWHRSDRSIFGKGKHGRTSFSENLIHFMDSNYWTVYKKKTNEYRVHIAFGEIIAIQEKKLREKDHTGQPINPEDVDFRIQTGTNGFILRKTDEDVVDRVKDLAKDVVKASKLDFGAVDIINNRVTKKSFAYKYRAAPILNEDLAVDYGKAFQKRLDKSPI